MSKEFFDFPEKAKTPGVFVQAAVGDVFRRVIPGVAMGHEEEIIAGLVIKTGFFGIRRRRSGRTGGSGRGNEAGLRFPGMKKSGGTSVAGTTDGAGKAVCGLGFSVSRRQGSGTREQGSERQGSGTREQGLGKRSFSVCGDGISDSWSLPERQVARKGAEVGNINSEARGSAELHRLGFPEHLEALR